MEKVLYILSSDEFVESDETHSAIVHTSWGIVLLKMSYVKKI